MAISGLVMPVVVDAIERVLLAWPLAHVGEEIAEGKPPFADFDAAPAVPLPLRRSGVEAAALHRFPRSVGHSAFFMPRVPVAAKGRSKVASEAATAFRKTASQVCSKDNFLIAAVAAAKKIASSFDVRETNHRPAFKSHICEIEELGQ